MKVVGILVAVLAVVTVPSLGQEAVDRPDGIRGFDTIVEIHALVKLDDSGHLESIAEASDSVATRPPNLTHIRADLVGHTVIKLGDREREAGGRITVLTEIVSMGLHGSHARLGPIIIRENPNEPSLGKLVGLRPNSLFPADSFFDVFFVVELPQLGVRLRNNVPGHGKARISKWPPLEVAYLGQMPSPLPLVGGGGVVRAAVIGVRHILVQPSHAIIKRELLQIEAKLNRLLRLHRHGFPLPEPVPQPVPQPTP